MGDEAKGKTANRGLIAPSLMIVLGGVLAWVGWGRGIAVYDGVQHFTAESVGFPEVVVVVVLALGVFLILKGLLKVLKLAKT